jgi:hypothetical protein
MNRIAESLLMVAIMALTISGCLAILANHAFVATASFTIVAASLATILIATIYRDLQS